MASQTSIEWTATVNEDGSVTKGFNWNVLSGCSRKSAGCENCYAEKMTKRLAAMGQVKYQGLLNDHGRFNGTIKFSEKDLLAPLSWKKPRKVFVNSMSDLFHEKVTDEMIDKAFAVMALTPQLTYQILTKRPERMREYLIGSNLVGDGEGRAWRVEQAMCEFNNWQSVNGESPEWPLPNVWLGVSVEDQKTADERIPLLLQTPAAVRWISAEPLLSAVDFEHFIMCDGENVDGEFLEKNGWAYDSWSGGFMGPNTHRDSCYAPEPGIHWIVVGGESGPNARPFDIQWARDIIAQCKAADVPVFVKQLGAKPYEPERYHKYGDAGLKLKNKKGGDPSEWPEDLRVREFPKAN